jgi:hypothetical protein
VTPGPAAPEPGDTLLAGRYRLVEERTGPTSSGRLWVGRDETLARPVAIRVLPLADPRAAALLDAAAAAGRLNHPGLAQVFDASEQDGFAYVVREWADGLPLSAVLEAGPLDPNQAQGITGRVADALRAAETGGLGHGRLHPGNVICAPDGSVKVTDLGISAVLAGVTPDAAADAAAIGEIGYACLTARWVGRRPHEGWGQLEAAPWSGGRPCSPRQVRAAVPRPLDGIVVRALAADLPSTPRTRAEPLSSPAAVARALQELPAPRSEQELATLTREQQRRRRLAGRSMLLAGLVAIGAVGWVLGLAVGRVPGQNRFSDLQRSATPTPGATAAGPIQVDAAAVQDFDPQGDGSENPTEAQLAVDGDPLTGWSTALYKKRADFGGLKDGVGLLIDLGKPTAVRQVAVAFLRPGADLEIRVADSRSERPEDYRVVAKATKAGDVATLTPSSGPVTARFWLVWLTRLPRDGSGFRTTIGEVQLRR